MDYTNPPLEIVTSGSVVSCFPYQLSFPLGSVSVDGATAAVEFLSSGGSGYVPYTGADQNVDLGTFTVSAAFNSQFGSATQYFKIEALDLGAGGIYPMLAAYSDGPSGNLGAIADALIIYDKANVDRALLLFVDNTGLITSQLYFTPSTNSWTLGAGELSINGDISMSAYDVDAQSFIIGANTLGSTEFSYLDGQDQTVAQASSPIFANLVITAGGDIKPSANSTTAISIAQADGTNIMTFDTTNSRIGIGTGTSAPGAFWLDIVGDARNMMQMTRYWGTSAPSTGHIGYRQSRGTEAVPTKMLANDQILAFGAAACHGSGFSTGGNKAFTAYFTAEDWDDNNNVGTFQGFCTTHINSTTPQIHMFLTPSGGLWIGESDNTPIIGTDFVDGIGRLVIDSGTGVGSAIRLLANATTGRTATDGVSYEINISGGPEIRLWENIALSVYDGASNSVVQIGASTGSVVAISNGFVRQYDTFSNTATLNLTNDIAQCTTEGMTIYLPTASAKAGRMYAIDNASTGSIVVAVTGAESLQGASSQTVLVDSCIQVYSDGVSTWRYM